MLQVVTVIKLSSRLYIYDVVWARECSPLRIKTNRFNNSFRYLSSLLDVFHIYIYIYIFIPILLYIDLMMENNMMIILIILRKYNLYAIAYAIVNSMDNLRFGKENYFHVFVFYTGYFIKETENVCSYIRYRNTRGSLGEH